MTKVVFEMNETGWDLADKLVVAVLKDCLKNKIETKEDRDFVLAVKKVLKRFMPERVR